MANNRTNRSNFTNDNNQGIGNSTQGGRFNQDQDRDQDHDDVSDLSAEHHDNAAFHHESAAMHHRQASEHRANGNHADADRHTSAAYDHGKNAYQHGAKAEKHGQRAAEMQEGRGSSANNMRGSRGGMDMDRNSGVSRGQRTNQNTGNNNNNNNNDDQVTGYSSLGNNASQDDNGRSQGRS